MFGEWRNGVGKTGLRRRLCFALSFQSMGAGCVTVLFSLFAKLNKPGIPGELRESDGDMIDQGLSLIMCVSS